MCIRVSHQDVLRVFQENTDRLRELLKRLIAAMPQERGCSCGQALETARA